MQAGAVGGAPARVPPVDAVAWLRGGDLTRTLRRGFTGDRGLGSEDTDAVLGAAFSACTTFIGQVRQWPSAVWQASTAPAYVHVPLRLCFVGVC